MSLQKLMSLREKLNTRTLSGTQNLLVQVEESLEFAEDKIVELDNFVDYLVDRFNGDREELMNQFKVDCEDNY
ncbi:hypothetical protein [Exiguobacterium sp. s133]|uniref:hypothetical protein n=1 Tax=Exiguobacterium sp. s133 TaxID=2751213 RepID=UPI001BE6F19F|nr:hypothetical protein [Exiguobacterium sp. s133]